MPNDRGPHDAVGLASTSVAYLRSGWEEDVEHSAVGAVAMAAERGAQAVVAERGRESRGSLYQPNERTSALANDLRQLCPLRATARTPLGICYTVAVAVTVALSLFRRKSSKNVAATMRLRQCDSAKEF